MNIEATEASRGSRWPTINTKLAACLLVYGYRLCAEQPFIRIASARLPDKISTSIWFDDGHPNFITPSTTQDWEVAWRHWDELVNKTGRYEFPPDWREPLIFMRRALDARQWLATEMVTKGRVFNDQHPEPAFKTEDIAEAVCLRSLGLRIFSSVGGRFVFDGTKANPLHKHYLETGFQCPMQWAKSAFFQQEELVNKIKHPDNTPNVQMKVGGQIAFVPVNMPPSVREPLVRLLYAA